MTGTPSSIVVMSSLQIKPNMAACHRAATVIQSAWRSCVMPMEPVYDENRRLLGFVDQQEMEWLADPEYAKWVLEEEEGKRDPLSDRLACERLAIPYESRPRKTAPLQPPPLVPLERGRYFCEDDECGGTSMTCKQCWRFFCEACSHGTSEWGRCHNPLCTL